MYSFFRDCPISVGNYACLCLVCREDQPLLWGQPQLWGLLYVFSIKVWVVNVALPSHCTVQFLPPPKMAAWHNAMLAPKSPNNLVKGCVFPYPKWLDSFNNSKERKPKSGDISSEQDITRFFIFSPISFSSLDIMIFFKCLKNITVNKNEKCWPSWSLSNST